VVTLSSENPTKAFALYGGDRNAFGTQRLEELAISGFAVPRLTSPIKWRGAFAAAVIRILTISLLHALGVTACVYAADGLCFLLLGQHNSRL
jgi:hypothetical protein